MSHVQDTWHNTVNQDGTKVKVRSTRYGKGDRYQARLTLPNGQERAKRFARKIDAERWLAEQITDRERGEWADPRDGRILFADFVEWHYKPTRQLKLELTTKVRDDSYLKTLILPTFGSRSLAAIEHTDCQKWINELASRRAPATVLKASQIMKSVMAMAVKSKRLTYNPMTDVEHPKPRPAEDIFLTPAKVKDLAEAMTTAAPRFRALVWLGCYAGPRIGELAALRWSDIDWLGRSVKISKKVIEVHGHGMVEGTTKTRAGVRTVPLPRLVVAELEAHRAEYECSEYVFTSPDGKPIRANNLRRRDWTEATLGCDLGRFVKGEDGKSHYEGMTFHDMRHTAVSLWVAGGATDMQVAKWAGHTSAAFTKARYAHLFPESGAEVTDRLDAFIESATATPAARIIELRREA